MKKQPLFEGVMPIRMIDILIVILFFIGFYGLIAFKSILKSVVSIILMETAVVMFFLSIGYQVGILPPIGHGLQIVADPLPQALMITAIIIGLAVNAICVTMLLSVFRQYNASDWDTVKRRDQE